MIIRQALAIAVEHGIEAVTLQSVADALKTTRQRIAHHFDLDELREAAEACAFRLDHPLTVPVMAHAVTGPRSGRYTVTADQLARISAWIIGGRA